MDTYKVFVECTNCGESYKEEQDNVLMERVGTKVYINQSAPIEPKTEDTGECKCHCHKGHLKEHGFNYNNCSGQTCNDCKASGVSKETSTKDSYDTIPAPLNKDWSDRFKELFQPEGTALKYINVNNFVVVEEIIKFISKEIESARASERKSLIEEVRKSLNGASLIDDPTLLVKIDIEEKLDELLSKIEE